MNRHHENSSPPPSPREEPLPRRPWSRPRVVFREPIESLVAGCTGAGAKTPVNVPMCSFGGS